MFRSKHAKWLFWTEIFIAESYSASVPKLETPQAPQEIVGYL